MTDKITALEKERDKYKQLAEDLAKTIQDSSRILDSIKCEIYASVCTMDEDELGRVFYVRDNCDLTLAKYKKALEELK